MGAPKIDLRGFRVDIDLEKGSDVNIDFYPETNGSPTDLSGYTGARLSIRASESESATLLLAKTGTISAPSSAWPSGLTGYYRVRFTIADTDTDKTAFSDTSGYYKSEVLDASSNVEPLAHGSMGLYAEVDQQ